MDEDVLAHYGVLGMKWGVRRFQDKSGKSTPLGKARKKSSNNDKPTDKSGLKELTNDEIKSRISRLELEKKYKELIKNDEQKKTSKGKDFVINILENSGKNIGTQLATYAMGTLVNKVAGSDVVNPKKGQKDK